MAQGDHPRIVIGNPLDRPGTQSPHEPDQAILAPDARVPAEWVAAKGHAGQRGEKIAPVACPHDFLDQHGHSLVVVKQAHTPAVGQCVRADHAGIDSRDRVHQFGKIAVGCALTRQEVAVVLAGKGEAKVVLQETGGAHDDRRIPYLVEQTAEPVLDVFREIAAYVRLSQLGIVSADLVQALVLLVHKGNQVVEGLEVIEDVRSDKVRVGNGDAFAQCWVRFCPKPLHDLPGQHHPSRFAPDLASPDPSMTNLFEIVDSEKLPRQAHKVKLVAEHTFGQNDDHLLQVMLYLGLSLRFIALILLTESKEHRPGCQLGIERKHKVLVLHLRIDHFLDDVVQECGWAVVRKVKVAEVVPNGGQTLSPGVRVLVYQRIAQSLPDLRLSGLVPQFFLKVLWRDDASPKDLLAHSLPDLLG